MDELAKMRGEIEHIKDEQRILRAERKADEKDRIRYEVLDFANSCRNGRRHTRDEFQHIIDMNDKYEKLLRETNDKNGVFVEEYRYIVELYHKCQKENDFLS
jgi:aspartyl/asparaginyl-tRNA synthetase